MTLLTPYPTEYGTTLSLKQSNKTNNKTLKILGIALDPKLAFSQHVNITITIKQKKCLTF